MSAGDQTQWDVVVVGGGPAGAVCAAICARGGLRVAVLERAIFPREKVCGDCLNPGCWPILRRLGLVERLEELPHARLKAVDFVSASGRVCSCALPMAEDGEITVKRRDFDRLLLERARECGAEVYERCAVTTVERGAGGVWRIAAGDRTFAAPTLIAADGRNSTVARLLGLLPPAGKDRVGLQTHFPLPDALRGRVVMRFLPHGYCGLADVGGGEANLCLVAGSRKLEAIKEWANGEFGLGSEQAWRSITPLERRPARPGPAGVLLLGDAARVVEPFTGEGIYYALASGELAGDCVVKKEIESYEGRQRALYRGRLWVNLLARTACKYPQVASAMLGFARAWPGLLRLLTRKVVVGSGASSR